MASLNIYFLFFKNLDTSKEKSLDEWFKLCVNCLSSLLFVDLLLSFYDSDNNLLDTLYLDDILRFLHLFKASLPLKIIRLSTESPKIKAKKMSENINGVYNEIYFDQYRIAKTFSY